jgi:hypothetical protein
MTIHYGIQILLISHKNLKIPELKEKVKQPNSESAVRLASRDASSSYTGYLTVPQGHSVRLCSLHPASTRAEVRDGRRR